MLRQALDAGTNLVRCDALPSIEINPAADGQLRLTGDGLEPLLVDMVVLANGMVPAAGAQHLAEMLHLERDEDGFFKADHDLIHATGSSIDGVYLAGCAAGPIACRCSGEFHGECGPGRPRGSEPAGPPRCPFQVTAPVQWRSGEGWRCC